MTKTHFESVDEYLAAQPETAQGILKRVRSTIRKTLPLADESISYNLPTYKMQGRPVIYFAGWKGHYSFYPATDRVVATFKDDLAPYEVNDKGTIRFPLADPVPVRLIEGIAKLRAKEVAEREKPKAAARKQRAVLKRAELSK